MQLHKSQLALWASLLFVPEGVMPACGQGLDRATVSTQAETIRQRSNSMQAAEQSDLFGCGPPNEKHKLVSPKVQHPTPDPPSGKALIYVIRKKGARFRVFPQNKLAANGRWVAVLKRGTYSFFESDPGLVRLCYSGDDGLKEGSGFLHLTVETGKTYFLRGDTGAWGQRTELLQLSEAEGRALVAESTYVTFSLKR